MTFPLMLYAQEVRELSPTRSALLLVPMAVITGVLSPFSGRLTDRANPRYLASFGLACCSIALFWLSRVIDPDVPIWKLLLPIALLGVANAFMWGPIGSTATRNLPLHQAGAGAGVYNTTRQVGAVLGSAGIAVLMESRLAHNLPTAPGGAPAGEGAAGGKLPEMLHQGFSDSMAQSLMLPAAVLLIGLVAALLFAKPIRQQRPADVPGSNDLEGLRG